MITQLVICLILLSWIVAAFVCEKEYKKFKQNHHHHNDGHCC
jgi:hypothetical protein